MITTDQFYQASTKAGLTRPLSWAPSGGGALQMADVLFKAESEDGLSGDVATIKYTARYPATKLAGMKRGEVVTISGQQYTVRESPRSLKDGSELELLLRKGA
jgi:hypothetical protein